MMDKKQAIGATLRTLLAGGSFIRLLNWAAQKPEQRMMTIEVGYRNVADGLPEAHWKLSLIEEGKEPRDFPSDTVEGAIVQAVVSVGR